MSYVLVARELAFATCCVKQFTLVYYKVQLDNPVFPLFDWSIGYLLRVYVTDIVRGGRHGVSGIHNSISEQIHIGYSAHTIGWKWDHTHTHVAKRLPRASEILYAAIIFIYPLSTLCRAVRKGILLVDIYVRPSRDQLTVERTYIRCRRYDDGEYHPVLLERVVGNSVHTVIYSDYKGRYVCDSYALHVSP